MSVHPTYPNNTIQEALCELRLRPAKEPAWNTKTPGEIFKALDPANFPGMEPITEMGVELKIDQGQPKPQFIQGPPKFRFSNADDSRLVQASPILYAFSCIRSYEHWDSFREEILSNWTIVRPIIQPEAIERIGIRYINRIPQGEEGAGISKWLQESRYIPKGVSEAPLGVKYRAECNLSEADLIIVSIITDPGDGTPHIIFDIDRVVRLSRTLSADELKDTMNALHEEIWDVFSGAKTEALEAYLNEVAT